MSVGYLLLYAALALVALWLVAELLLQQRAPLLWRAVTLGGFLGVVGGMELRSVLVIGAGAAGFALGQVMVTLSLKRGYAGGWSLRRSDGSLPGALSRVPLLSAATGGEAADAVLHEEPVGEVGPVEPEPEPSPVPYAATEELAADDGVYTTAEPYYQPQQEQQQYYYADAYQQTGYVEQQQWVAQQQYYYTEGYQQPQYQDPYGQQYQDPPPASGWGDPHAQQQWQYPQQPDQQEQYQHIPGQPQADYGYQHQQWAGQQ